MPYYDIFILSIRKLFVNIQIFSIRIFINRFLLTLETDLLLSEEAASGAGFWL